MTILSDKDKERLIIDQGFMARERFERRMSTITAVPKCPYDKSTKPGGLWKFGWDLYFLNEKEKSNVE
mgnify:CR=1 FL=1